MSGTCGRAIALSCAVSCASLVVAAPQLHAQQTQSNEQSTDLPPLSVTTSKKKTGVKKSPAVKAPTYQAQGSEQAVPGVVVDEPSEGEGAVRAAQEASGSITALSRQNIEDRGVTSVQDVGRQSPNVTLTDQGSPRFSVNAIRGIGNTVRDDYFNNSIGVYLDGVPLTTAEYSRRLGDIESIEVLRGPQGTLFGQNTQAGVINMTSRAPTGRFSSEVEGTIGNNGQRSTSAFISGPVIGNAVSGRLFFDYATRDGFTDYADSGKSIDDLESATGSGSLTFRPTERLTATLSGSIEHIDQGAYSYQLFDAYKARVVDITPPNEEVRDARSVSANVSYDFGAMQVRSITGYRSYDVEAEQDLSYNPNVASFGGGRTSSDEDGQQFSQEVRLTGTVGPAFSWVAGAFYQNTDMTYVYDQSGAAVGSFFLDTEYDRREVAGYGEGTLTILRNLDLTAGVRVSREHHETANNYGITGSANYNLVTPKFAVAYHFNPDQQVYASATRGARSGGFNRLSFGDEFDPEYLWSYEAGVKNQLFGRTVTLNAAAFYIDWTNQQIRTQIAPGNVQIDNAGSAHSQGFELEASWRPTTGLELSGFLGISHGEYDEYINRFGVDLAGNTLVNMPELSGGLAAQYRWPLNAYSLMGILRGEYLYTGAHYFDAENRLEQDGYGLVNLRAGVENDDFSVMLFAKNLFDTDYRSYGYRDFESSAFATDIAIAGESRLIGATAKLKF